MTKRFQKNKEDFICENCGEDVFGNGFTNHCPECLYSKHVDVNPGDRLDMCSGLMPAIRIEKKEENYILLHRCEKCGFERRNKMSKDDNFDAVLKISEDQ